MGFLVSPGVEVNEIDLTNIIPALSTSVGAYAGYFNWGPAGEVVTVSSEKELAQVFGAPEKEDSAEVSFFTAASFLKYGNNLKVSRAIPTDAYNATSGDGSPEANFTISNRDELELNAGSLQTDGADVIARYVGELGNSIKTYIVDSAVLTDSPALPANVSGALPYEPDDTVFGATTSGAGINDEVHVVVVDSAGKITGSKGAILEVHAGLSTAQNAKSEYGDSNYFVTVINNNSSFIWLSPEATPTVLDEDSTPLVNGFTSDGYTLTGGSVGTMTTAGPVETALTFFDDAIKIDINLIFAQNFADGATYVGSATQTVDNKLVEIANARKDSIAFISSPLDIVNKTSESDKKTAILEKFSSISSSSYIFFDSSPAYVYNKYRDGYVWIPLSGHMAGLCAGTDDVADPWFSPAGYTRGNVLGVTKLAYNPDQVSRDELYSKRVNPVVSFPGQGIVLFGDKTGLTKPSAFDRINVRRLFTTIEKAIATASKFQLFELNDDFTRSTFRNAVEPYLRDVQGRRGITDFKVICDETNNTGDVIDGNRFVADIYIKPSRSINFISLNFIATRTGVSFDEIIGE